VAVGDLKPNDSHDPERLTVRGSNTFGQLIDYAGAVFDGGHRTFVFIFVIMSDTARVARLDPDGVIFSDLIRWRTETFLAEFFWRLANSNDAQRGWDTTVSVLEHDGPEAVLAKDIAQRHWDDTVPSGLCVDDAFPPMQPLSMFHIWHDPQTGDECSRMSNYTPSPPGGGHCHRLVAYKSRTPLRPVIGRYTRGYIAVDLDEKQLVWLKDTWRISLHSIPQESDTYRLLHNKGVDQFFLPGFLFGSDVFVNSESPDERVVQTSKTYHFVKMNPEFIPGGALAHGDKVVPTDESAPAEENAPVEEGAAANVSIRGLVIEPHTHHRIVYKKIGRELHKFTRTKELCQTVRDCLYGSCSYYSWII
jgi:hypothetical protein